MSASDTTSVCALNRSSYGHLNLTTPNLKLSRSLGVTNFGKMTTWPPNSPDPHRIEDQWEVLNKSNPLRSSFVTRALCHVPRAIPEEVLSGRPLPLTSAVAMVVVLRLQQETSTRHPHCNRIYQCYLLYQLVLWKVQYVWSRSQAVKYWHQSVSVWQSGSETPRMIPLLKFRNRSSDFCVFTFVEWEQHARQFVFYRSERLNDTLTAVSSVWVTRKNRVNGSRKPWNTFHKHACYHQPNVYVRPPCFRRTCFNIASQGDFRHFYTTILGESLCSRVNWDSERFNLWFSLVE